MRFAKQLRLLLWKNITLRKRQPVRFFMEIFWPIILMGLLAIVRMRNLQEIIPECHFDEKALPSAGIIPMLQSYICTFNNTCKSQSTDDQPGVVNMYHDSHMSQIFRMYRDYTRTGKIEDSPELQSLLIDLSEIEKSNYSTESTVKFVGKFICGSNAEIFSMNEDNFEDNTGLTIKKLEQISDPEHINTVKIPEKVDRAENVRNTSDPEYCKKELTKLESSSGVKLFLWRALKPFVLGKLLYTPNTVLTRRLVRRMNQTFESVHAMNWMGKEFVKRIPTMRDYLDLLIEQTGGVIPTMWLPVIIDDSLLGNRSTLIRLRDNLKPMGTVIDDLANTIACADLNKFVALGSENDLSDVAETLLRNDTFWGGIVFETLQQASSQPLNELPPFLRYKIRYNVDRVDPTVHVKDPYWTPGPRHNFHSDLKYWLHGFVQLQDMAERAVMMETLRQQDLPEWLPGTYLQQVPYHCYVVDPFFKALSGTFPLIMTLAWVFTTAMMMKSIVYEKEKRLKETMLMMGLRNGANRLALFLETFVTMHISILFLVIILGYGNVLSLSEPFLIYIFVLVFCLSTVAFSFFMSVFFSKSNIAAAAGGILFFTSYLPYSFMMLWEDRLPFLGRLISCAIPNTAFAWGSLVFVRREEQGLGVQFSNINESPTEGDHFTLIHAMGMLLVDSIVMFILTWYLEGIMPGRYGIARPWYFPVTSTYWFGSQRKTLEVNTGETELHEVDHKTGDLFNFELEPRHTRKGVEIKNLRKVFNNGKVAINGLSLNVYEGITALLGHNGAGKTTTFSILCGLIPATSGSAKIYGYDVETEMDRIRKSFGFCPQHNVLWDDMTVEEHLDFYASLKIDERKAIMAEIDAMLEILGLQNKRHELTKNLSGGMQRKLSVAIAYIGGAKVVLLDEPTAGVDPWARRGIWNLLIQFRKDRTTIMSTHFHGEADTLSDRIAIIAEGKSLCYGSPVFLKKRFGTGYHLTLVKTGAAASELEIRNFIRLYVPDATLISSAGCELSYVLTTPSNQAAALSLLFEALDANLGFLEVSSYGIRDTSLEEVFLRVMDKHDGTTAPEVGSGNVTPDLLDSQLVNANGMTTSMTASTITTCSGNGAIVPGLTEDWNEIKNSVKRLEGAHLQWQQMKAMYIKRFHNLRRSKKGFACEIVLPAVFVCVAMLVTLLTPGPQEQPALELTPWVYGPPNHIFFANNQPRDPDMITTERNLYVGPGLGTRCMNGEPVKGKPCVPLKLDENLLVPTYQVSRNSTPDCSCTEAGQMCPAGAGGPIPPCMLLNTTDWLCNLNGRNLSDWLSKTSKISGDTRYGGFTFGEIDEFGPNLTDFGPRGPPAINFSKPEGFAETEEDLFRLYPGLYTRQNVKVWFNNRGWASSVSYVNAINNVIMRSNLKPGSNPFAYGIMAVNHPLNMGDNDFQAEIAAETTKAFLQSVCIIFALSFVPASFVMFLIEERVSGAKNLQFTSKVRPWLYWISTFTWDLLCYLLTVTLCLCIFLAFSERAYISEANAPVLVCLLALYGFATIPMMYIPSFYFKVPSSAFVALACSNLFLGLVSTISVFLLEYLDDLLLTQIAAQLRKILLVLPQYCLGRGVMDLAIMHVTADVHAKFGQVYEEHPFHWIHVGRNICCLCVQGVLFFVLTILVEYKFFFNAKNQAAPLASLDNEDRDVTKERLRLMSDDASNSVLKVAELTKTFTQRKKVHVAVDRVSFGIGKGECFGLLGVNGAGKSTTFKMLTGNLTPTSGDAFVNDHSIKTNMYSASQYIGYCPQFDAINDLLTGREHLQYYARIHGIPERYVKLASEWCIRHLQLTPHASRSAGGYSGGNKRKLSTAIALIGDPDIMFLDEPTTGMDPKARRFLWNCILGMVMEGRSVTLTSHSLEECEILCTKLAIMVNGRFQCFGSLQHLKSRFGFGYSIIIRCSPATLEEVCHFMETTFRRARLQEKHYNTVQYRIPQTSVKLFRLFSAIEQNRERLEIEDSSVNQTNLEDIFIEFAKHQSDLAATDEISEVADESLPNSPMASQLQINLETLSRTSSFATLPDLPGSGPTAALSLDSVADRLHAFSDERPLTRSSSSPCCSRESDYVDSTSF